MKKNFLLGDYEGKSNKVLLISHMEEIPLKELSEYNRHIAIDSIGEAIDYFKKRNGIIVKIGTAKSGGLAYPLQKKLEGYAPVIDFTESSTSSAEMKAMQNSGLELLLYTMKPQTSMHMDIILSGIYYHNLLTLAKDITRQRSGSDSQFNFTASTADNLIGKDSVLEREYPAAKKRKELFELMCNKKAKYEENWRSLKI